jgi:hypothetical protein
MDLRAFPGMGSRILGIDRSLLKHTNFYSFALAPEVGSRRCLEAVRQIATRRIETGLYERGRNRIQ